MKKITVENIVDAMVLAKDVCGRRKYPAGRRYDADRFDGRRLKNWASNFVHIESEEDRPQENVRVFLRKKSPQC